MTLGESTINLVDVLPQQRISTLKTVYKKSPEAIGVMAGAFMSGAKGGRGKPVFFELTLHQQPINRLPGCKGYRNQSNQLHLQVQKRLTPLYNAFFAKSGQKTHNMPCPNCPSDGCSAPGLYSQKPLPWGITHPQQWLLSARGTLGCSLGSLEHQNEMPSGRDLGKGKSLHNIVR